VSVLSKNFLKGPSTAEIVPQRLKPRSKQSIYGTAEAVPLSKAGVFQQVPKRGCHQIFRVWHADGCGSRELDGITDEGMKC
jgi:hypothetical protein